MTKIIPISEAAENERLRQKQLEDAKKQAAMLQQLEKRLAEFIKPTTKRHQKKKKLSTLDKLNNQKNLYLKEYRFKLTL